MKAGTAYEILVQEIVQLLLLKEGINIKVQHDVDLLGKSGAYHQVDVYWEYKMGGIVHKVAISCKDYSTKSVEIGHVRDLCAIMEDVPGLRGIIVTKIGFQSGAITLAKEKNIILRLIREPIVEDWEGRVKSIHVQMSMIMREIIYSKISYDVDQPWHIEQAGNPLKEIKFNTTTDNIRIVDKPASIDMTFLDLQNNLPTSGLARDELLTHRIEFTDGYLYSPGQGPIKLKSIIIPYYIREYKEELTIESDAQYIVKDIFENVIYFIDKDGNVKGDE